MAEVIWSESALADLEAIASYIALDKPGAATRLVRKIFSRVEQLAVFPDLGRRPRELKGTRYRQLVVAPVRIFYRIEAGRVFIVYLMRGESRFCLRNLDSR